MYDCIIIGAGPAGISAGIYAARASMKTIIIEKGTPGGLIAKTDEIANYPGVEDVPTGSELIERMIKQAKSLLNLLLIQLLMLIYLELPK